MDCDRCVLRHYPLQQKTRCAPTFQPNAHTLNPGNALASVDRFDALLRTDRSGSKRNLHGCLKPTLMRSAP